MSHDARPDVSPPTAAPVSAAKAVMTDASIRQSSRAHGSAKMITADGGYAQRVSLGIVGRPVPFHATEQAGADVRAGHARLRVGILAGCDRHLVEQLARIAVEHAQEAVLAADRHQVALLAVDGRTE